MISAHLHVSLFVGFLRFDIRICPLVDDSTLFGLSARIDVASQHR